MAQIDRRRKKFIFDRTASFSPSHQHSANTNKRTKEREKRNEKKKNKSPAEPRGENRRGEIVLLRKVRRVGQAVDF